MDEAGGTAARLKAARERAGLTQKQAAEAAGVHQVSVARWETGRAIGARDVARLAQVYGVPVGVILGEADSPSAIAAPGAGLSDYARGVLHAAHRMSATVTALIEEVMGAAAVPAGSGAPAVPVPQGYPTSGLVPAPTPTPEQVARAEAAERGEGPRRQAGNGRGGSG